jgi:nicotinamidase/pyrazinamidase
MKNIIFVAVDCQRDFMLPDGALPVPNAMSIALNLAELTKIAQEFNFLTINTVDYHNEMSKEISNEPDYINTFPPHCMVGTAGHQLIPEVVTAEHFFTCHYKDLMIYFEDVDAYRNIIIAKDKFDVFEGNPHTKAIIKHINPKNAIVYGVATDYCVKFAVEGLLSLGINVVVVSDAIKELKSESMGEYADKRIGLLRTQDVRDFCWNNK